MGAQLAKPRAPAKVHQAGIPLRPALFHPGRLIERLTKMLTVFLTESKKINLKRSRKKKEKVQDVRLDENEVLNILHVKGLLSDAPVKMSSGLVVDTVCALHFEHLCTRTFFSKILEVVTDCCHCNNGKKRKYVDRVPLESFHAFIVVKSWEKNSEDYLQELLFQVDEITKKKEWLCASCIKSVRFRVCPTCCKNCEAWFYCKCT